jgi:hypothetical protein
MNAVCGERDAEGVSAPGLQRVLGIGPTRLLVTALCF